MYSGNVIWLVRISDFHLSTMNNKNRGSLEIVRDMLSVASEKCKKTRMLYDAHLNFSLLEKYLNILLKNGLLEPVDGSFYLVTWKGNDFLQKFEDYLERCSRVDKQINDVLEEKVALKNMCFNNEPSSEQNRKENLSFV